MIAGTCEVDDPNNLRFCEQGDYDVPFATQFKLAGSYPMVWDIRLSATIQSTPGTERMIQYQVTRTQIPTLTQTSVNVRLNEPGTEYNDRVNQLDLSLSRTFRSGRYVFRPEMSLFNALNANPVLQQVNNFGPALGNVTGTGVLPPRLLRLRPVYGLLGRRRQLRQLPTPNVQPPTEWELGVGGWELDVDARSMKRLARTWIGDRQGFCS